MGATGVKNWTQAYDPSTVFIIVTCVLLSVEILSCSNDPAPSDDIVTVIDDLGRTMDIKRHPERIVTMAPNLTELVFAAGAGHLLVGIGLADDYPPEVESIPRFSTLPPDFESIATFAPDLIFATDHVNNPRDAEMLEALGFPTFFMTFGQLSDIADNIRKIGTLLGTTSSADAVADSLDRSFEHIATSTRSRAVRPQVLVLIGDDVLYSFGRESYVHEMVDIAGGISVTARIDAEAPVLNEEFVLASKPDVIIGTLGASYESELLLAYHPTWDVIPAVRDLRVYGVDPDYILRPGPRLLEGTYRLAALFHPDIRQTLE